MGAAATSALVGLIGVLVGVWLSAKQERRRWVLDQKVRASVDFITRTGLLYTRLRELDENQVDPAERIEWRNSMQAGRSTIHLLCGDETRVLADRLVSLVNATSPQSSDEHHAATITTLNDLTDRLRRELGIKKHGEGSSTSSS
jgi:hypothetical protein